MDTILIEGTHIVLSKIKKNKVWQQTEPRILTIDTPDGKMVTEVFAPDFKWRLYIIYNGGDSETFVLKDEQQAKDIEQHLTGKYL